MKKIINGKTLNTETAREMGSYSNGGSGRDFQHYEETLYRNNKGTWFLYGVGGPMTQYRVSAGQNSWSGGADITPMTEEEAREWAEVHLDADDYAKAFGEAEEAAPSDLVTRSRVNVVLDTELYERFKTFAATEKMPVSRLLDRAIKETYNL